MWGEMFRGKYAQKDASKVNMYEIAQLSWASAAPAKSCAEMEATSKGEGFRREEKNQKQREKFSLLTVNNKGQLVALCVSSPLFINLLLFPFLGNYVERKSTFFFPFSLLISAGHCQGFLMFMSACPLTCHPLSRPNNYHPISTWPTVGSL